jgi:hypothetical protein
MRTTIDIPDALGRLVKIRTAQNGEPLKALVARALEREVCTPLNRARRGTVPALPILKSRTPGAMALTPDDISAVLAREEAAAYETALRR